MRWLILLAAAALAAVAAAGVLWPFGRNRQVALERLADPLEDERLALLRALRDLEKERAAGALADPDYRELRGETEARAVAVLRALEARDGSGELPASLREMRSTAAGDGRARSERRPLRMLPALVVGAVMVAIIVPLLAGAVGERDAGQPLTGSAVPGAAGDPTSLEFFEQRVRDHPDDVAARLDLAQRYRDADLLDAAAAQYVASLDLDPDNAEGLANLGFLVYLGGEPAEGLASVERALELEPGYPEALYFQGVILLEGLDRPDEAASAFRAYLEAAPFGARRAEVEDLLARAEAAGGGS
jgi:tetratricopeptide (TPR) repeat protein